MVNKIAASICLWVSRNKWIVAKPSHNDPEFGQTLMRRPSIETPSEGEEYDPDKHRPHILSSYLVYFSFPCGAIIDGDTRTKR